jgi:ATP-binding cassette subfamily C protein LapB
VSDAASPLPRDLPRPDDPLTTCLVVITRYFHRPVSASTLTAGLPLPDSKLTPELFGRAAQRAGFSSQLLRRRLDQISSITLPAVMLLQNGSACVATDRDEAGNWKVIQPESGEGESTLSTEQLAAAYTGQVIFCRPAYRFDSGAHDAIALPARHWFWDVVRHAWPLYGEVLLAALLLNLFALVIPLFTLNIYDRVVPNQAIETLWVLASGAMLVTVFDLAMKTMRSYFLEVAGKQIDTALSARIFERVLGLRSTSRSGTVGGMANTLQEYEGFRDFLTSATVTTIIDLPFVVIFLLIMFWLGGPLVIVPLVAIPLMIGANLMLQKPLELNVRKSLCVASQKQAMLIETLTGIEAIKAIGAESPVQRRWEETVVEAGRLGTQSKILASIIVNLTQFFQQTAYLIVVVWGVYLIGDRNLTIGGLIACTILTTRTLAPFAQIAGLVTRYYQSLQALRGIDALMRLEVERPAGASFVHRPALYGDIEFRNVTFAYPGQEEPALNQVSFRFRRGERVGIIGRIGSGKSTVEKMMLGLYQPQTGSIWLDGIDLKQIDPAELRKSIGHVPQDVTLFHGSVRDNIVLGAPYVDDAAVLRAADMAGVSEFVRRHPKGFDMPVGERGAGLSGGQRQAISVARALLLDPPILIFDEPPNALDNRSEDYFKQQLARHLRDQTVILVTHRTSLLSLVSRLVVLDNGRVVADGPKEKVLEALSGGRVHAPGN